MVAPETASAELLGKTVSSLQSNIHFNNGVVTGTLKYVTGYTGYSGDPALQSGNFLAYKVDSDVEGVTYRSRLIGGTSGWVTLDSDKNVVARITDSTTILEVEASKEGYTTARLMFDLTKLKRNNS